MNTLYDIWTTKHARNFAAGLQLLPADAPVTSNIRMMLMRRANLPDTEPTAYELGKLEIALKKCPATAATETDTPLAESLPEPAPAAPPHPKTPEHIKSLHKEHAHYHALMVQATTDAERAEYAAKIVDKIAPALDAEYAQLRAAAEPDQSPAPAPKTFVTDADKLRAIQSLRSQISQLRARLKKPGNHTETHQKIAAKQRQLDALDT